MRVDLHNHTVLCNHAKGTVDDYIERAIEIGIDIYGFSEHAPMNFDKKYRIGFDEMDTYTSLIENAQRKYRDKIKILLGYEVDYMMGYMDKRVLKAPVDYLIGSVHFIGKWGFDHPDFKREYHSRDINQIWQEYFDAVEGMAKTGYFDIVGHLDLIKVFNFMPRKDIRLIAKNALKAIKRSNMVIELNGAGLRKPIREIYPSPILLEDAYELDIPITFSSDAHALEHIGYGYDEVVKIAKNIGYRKIVTFERKEQKLFIF